MQKLFAGAAVALLATAVGSPGLAITYQETFSGATSATQQERLREVGWCGGQAGDPVCANRPGDPFANNSGGDGANSFGVGVGTDAGFGFFSTRQNADAYLFTEEVSFTWSDLLSISWFSRDNGTSPAHLVFRSGTDWFVSSANWISDASTAWTQHIVDPVDLVFFKGSTSFSATEPTLARLPAIDVSGTASFSLTNEEINGFGFFYDGTDGTKRVDNVTLSAVPLPAAAWMLLAGIGSLFVLGRRRAQA